MSAYSRYEVPLGSAFKMAKKTLPTPKAWRDLSHHPFTPAKVLNGRRPSSPSSARTQKRGSNSRKWPRPGLSSSCYAVLSCCPVPIFIITNKKICFGIKVVTSISHQGQGWSDLMFSSLLVSSHREGDSPLNLAGKVIGVVLQQLFI